MAFASAGVMRTDDRVRCRRLPGRRRAVLLGCGIYGLRGCDADVALMAGILGRCGFDAIEKRTGADATRAGVVDAVEALPPRRGPVTRRCSTGPGTADGGAP